MAVQQYIQWWIDVIKKVPFFQESKAKKFIIDCLAELQNVTWPTWDDVKSSTAVVFVTVIAMSVFMGLTAVLLNLGHGRLMDLLHRILISRG